MNNRILIVDDNLNLSALLKRAFEGKGFECFVENRGESAVETAIDTEPDLIVLDVLMPGKSGLDVLNELRVAKSAIQEVPVILLTALAQDISVAESDNCGLISKPADLDELLKMINQFLYPSPNKLANKVEFQPHTKTSAVPVKHTHKTGNERHLTQAPNA